MAGLCLVSGVGSRDRLDPVQLRIQTRMRLLADQRLAVRRRPRHTDVTRGARLASLRPTRASQCVRRRHEHFLWRRGLREVESDVADVVGNAARASGVRGRYTCSIPGLRRSFLVAPTSPHRKQPAQPRPPAARPAASVRDVIVRVGRRRRVVERVVLGGSAGSRARTCSFGPASRLALLPIERLRARVTCGFARVA